MPDFFLPTPSPCRLSQAIPPGHPGPHRRVKRLALCRTSPPCHLGSGGCAWRTRCALALRLLGRVDGARAASGRGRNREKLAFSGTKIMWAISRRLVAAATKSATAAAAATTAAATAAVTYSSAASEPATNSPKATLIATESIILRDGRRLAFRTFPATPDEAAVPVYAFHGMGSSHLTWKTKPDRPVEVLCPGVQLIVVRATASPLRMLLARLEPPERTHPSRSRLTGGQARLRRLVHASRGVQLHPVLRRPIAARRRTRHPDLCRCRSQQWRPVCTRCCGTAEGARAGVCCHLERPTMYGLPGLERTFRGRLCVRRMRALSCCSSVTVRCERQMPTRTHRGRCARAMTSRVVHKAFTDATFLRSLASGETRHWQRARLPSCMLGRAV